MFKDWDFLLAEIWVLLALAALIGLFAGWLIWGGRSDLGSDADEVRRLRAELDRAKAQGRARLGDPLDDVPDMPAGGYSRPAQPAAPVATPAPAQVPPEPKPSEPKPEASPSEALAPTDTTAPEARRPDALSEPRDGLPDDLKKIKGIGVKLEQLCNRLGFFHYDQIATWSAQEIAWVDENLEGFKGRVTRDAWVDQAKVLAKNQTPAFVRRTD